MYRKTLLASFLLAISSTVISAMTPLWLRASAISPDGKTIAFTYKGNIFTVPSAGGHARQLTSNAAYDGLPVWSPSGKHIAFASEREGSMDIWLMTADGDELTRLTTHNGSETPLAFLNEEELLFSAAGTPTTDDVQFPSNVFTHLYKVRTKAGTRPRRVSDVSVGHVTCGPEGSLIYDAVKGYEDPWRKHHTSSITRDLWQLTPGDKKSAPSYRQLTSNTVEDRNPVYVPSSKTLYFLSELDGTLNVYSRTLEANAQARQLTKFKGDPVRWMTASNDGTLCFSQNGELYTLQPGQSPKKVNIQVTADSNERDEVRRILTNGASAVSHSPEGKEIAFILGGDVYVTSLDYKTTRQITDTPERERNVSFAKDGRSVVYDSERNGVWSIYRATIKNKDEKQFTYATEIEEERLTDGETTCFQPAYSPDGKKIAFLRNRAELCVMDAKSLKTVTAMPGRFQYSYRDGDQDFTWSPNSKWLLSEYIGTGGWNNKDIALVPADGSQKIVNLTNSGYSEGSPRWVLDGKAILFQSDRAGYRSHGSWGAEYDIYITFLNRESLERFRMNKEEREIADAHEKEVKDKAKKEREEKEKKEKEKKEKADKKRAKMSEEQLAKEKEKEEKAKKEREEKEAKEDSIKASNPEFDLDDLDLRTLRLTSTSSNMGDAVLNKDGTRLYYVASYALGTALWEKNLETGSTSIKSSGVSFSAFDLTKDGKTAYLTQGGQIKKLDVEAGSLKTIDFEAFNTNRPASRRAYLFEHVWHQTYEKLYDPNMNGADWKALYTRYKRFLPHIGNTRDFAEMLSELLGELNVSHTGCRAHSGGGAMGVSNLGVFIDDDYEGDGLRVVEVIKGTPISLFKQVTPGTLITHIDGTPIKAEADYYPLLSGKSGRYTRLTLDNKGKKEDITLRLTTSVSDELYRRWVERCEHLVDSLSKGRLAYVHIRAMDGESYHDLYRRLLSDKNRNREAVIVDTRHNGGGWLHNDVCELLSAQAYVQYTPRGQYVSTDPYNRWTKPSCMLICEDNYSNAHGTPWTYKELGIGKLIGAPVPGTMTAVWWESIDDITFGIPQVGALDRRGNYLENQQLEPDILLVAQPGDILHGHDAQLELAVRTMLGK